jgi:hypothetical protein
MDIFGDRINHSFKCIIKTNSEIGKKQLIFKKDSIVFLQYESTEKIFSVFQDDGTMWPYSTEKKDGFSTFDGRFKNDDGTPKFEILGEIYDVEITVLPQAGGKRKNNNKTKRRYRK